MEPYFILKISDQKEYNVLSERSFSYKNYKFYLDEQEMGIYNNCKNIGMRDQKAIEITRFIQNFYNVSQN